MSYHVGRLVDHVHLVVADLERSKRFYLAVLRTLGHEPEDRSPYYLQFDELFVSEPEEGNPLSHVHLAFQARDKETVQAFYETALANGGTDNGRPGERRYHPGYYAAFVYDPDGNNVEAVFHGPSTRSAESIAIDAA
jgi:catechol 2,3-dioxygenase-like lactoylglutathione lyase family enzyme